MKKACLIIPYYGKWPAYFDIYLESCKKNNWLDVFFFTDINSIPEHPENVIFINFTVAQIEQRVSQLTGLAEYQLPFTYKLCDLKPMYGDIFEAYLSKYDYWAFGDCDLVYGKIFDFIRKKLTDNIDFISFHDKYLSGSLTLIKNTANNNKLYLKLENLHYNIQSNIFEGIDEVCHNWNAKQRIELSPQCLTYWVEQETLNGILTSSFQSCIIEEVKKDDLIEYDKNILTYNRSEIAYFHYIKNKTQPIFSFPNWDKVPAKFYINETGFYKSKSKAIILRRLKKYPTLFLYYLKKLPNYLSRKLLSRS